MKNKIILFLALILSWVSYGQSVPDTETFSLNDVYAVVYGHAPTTTYDLNSCFANAVLGYFDTDYVTYPANSMLRFRNYTVTSQLPYTVLTNSITSITSNSFTVNSEIINCEGQTVTSRGIVFSTNPTPTTSDMAIVSGSGCGTYTIPVTSTSGYTILPSTLYYVRAYTVRTGGVLTYGNELTVTTHPTGEIFPCAGNYSYPAGAQAYPTTVNINSGSSLGTMDFYLDAVNAPDRAMLYNGGSLIYDSGYRSSTAAAYTYGGASRHQFTVYLNGKLDPIWSFAYPYSPTPVFPTPPEGIAPDGYPYVYANHSTSIQISKTSSNEITTVKVYAPMNSTVWNFTLGCPY